MTVGFIVQPIVQFGRLTSQLLEDRASPRRVIFVSAFAALQSVMRFKKAILGLRDSEVECRFVLGIDLGGTSREVLEEILSWRIDARIVKHRLPGHTFHPKIYLVEWQHQATILVGSNNLTEGGFFGNYECATRLDYGLPEDAEAFRSAYKDLRKFLEPEGSVSYALTQAFLDRLVARGELPTESEARQGRDVARATQAARRRRDPAGPVFGTEAIDPPPPLSADILSRLVTAVRQRNRRGRSTTRKQGRRTSVPPLDPQGGSAISVAAFYMTLPTLQGANIPGEGRIPLEAVELAREFWGWPDEYQQVVSPRAGRSRVYWNWKPTWRTWSVEDPGTLTVQPVRMYMYENSSDFRFYVRPLVNAGGNLGDVVRIVRVADVTAEYECVLAREGTAEYEEWLPYCTQGVRNSTRRFGYA